MSRSLVRRFGAVVLLAIFAGGGMGLAQLDALLYHSGHDTSPTGVAHVDPPGGCGAHSEHCVLATSAPVPQTAGVTPALGRVAVVTPDHSATAPVTRIPSSDRSFLQPSRAPPVAAS